MREYQLVEGFEVWPVDGLEHLGCCPLCASDQREALHQGLEDRTYYCAPGRWGLWRCKGCFCAYLDPRPTPAAIGMAYASYYTHTPAPWKDRNWLWRLKVRAANGYTNSHWNTDLQPASPALANLLGYFVIASDIRGLTCPGAGKRLLDVGCGSGDFLALAQQGGWSCMGVDFDGQAVAEGRSRGLEVYEGGVEILASESNAYDAITLSHVIEHVHDPLLLLQACQRLLKPGGYFWIETPNIESRGHHWFGSAWRGLEPPRHLTLFNADRLRTLMARSGFTKLASGRWSPAFLHAYITSRAIREQRDPRSAAPDLGSILKCLPFEIMNIFKERSREVLTLTATKQ